MKVTTHTEGRVVTHEHDEPIEVVQLPNRDAAAPPPVASAAPAPKPSAPTSTPAVKAAVTQQRVRTAKASKDKK